MQQRAHHNARSPIYIVIVDYNGDLVEVVGSEGRGPEELTGPRHFGFDHASNIVVYDYGLGLFKAFDRATGTVSSATSPFSEGLLIMSEIGRASCRERVEVGGVAV